jgi:hypothetical protein
LVDGVALSVSDPAWDERFKDWEAAWCWADNWLAKRADSEYRDDLWQRRGETDAAIRSLIAESAALRAWSHFFSRRVTRAQGDRGAQYLDRAFVITKQEASPPNAQVPEEQPRVARTQADKLRKVRHRLLSFAREEHGPAKLRMRVVHARIEPNRCFEFADRLIKPTLQSPAPILLQGDPSGKCPWCIVAAGVFGAVSGVTYQGCQSDTKGLLQPRLPRDEYKQQPLTQGHLLRSADIDV